MSRVGSSKEAGLIVVLDTPTRAHLAELAW